MIQYCKRCLYPSNHALNIILDDEGVCSGCRVHEEKDTIDFQKRFSELTRIVTGYRNKTQNNYDCIIPVTGGQDSFFIVDIIKNRLGMSPLLVNYNSQYNTPEGIRNLANLRIRFGVDLLQNTVSPEKVKKITRATLQKNASIYWHILAGSTVYPVQMAVQLKIPLIIWGAHQGVDQTGMFSHFDYVEMTRRYRHDHDLMGYEAEELMDEYPEIEERDVEPYIYPSNRELEKVGVRGIYLNNFIRWDTRSQHEYVIRKYGYEGREQTRTFDSYSNPDCYLYSDLHDYIKYLKHGYGKVNDHVAREIRLGHLSRSEGIQLINSYVHKKPKYTRMFCQWLGIAESGLEFILDQHRNKIFWYRDDSWQWEYNSLMSFKELPQDDYTYPEIKPFKEYEPTPKGVSEDIKDEFILIGRGYKPV